MILGIRKAKVVTLKPGKVRKPTPRLTWGHWLIIGVLALAAGGAAYIFVTDLVYKRAELVTRGAPAKLFELLSSNTEEKNAALPGDIFARQLGLEFTSEDDPLKRRLTGAFLLKSDPAVKVATGFIRKGDAKRCEPALRARMQRTLARLLVGWPTDNAKDVNILFNGANPGEPKKGLSAAEIEEGTRTECASYVADEIHLRDLVGLIWGRTEALPPRDIAIRIYGLNACTPGGLGDKAEADLAECRILEKLLESAASASPVRNSRMWANFFWGWERLAVATLFFAVIFAISSLWWQRRVLKSQAEDIAKWLREAELNLSPNKGISMPPTKAYDEAVSLYDKFRTENGGTLYDAKKHDKYIADGSYLADADGLALLKGSSPTALRDLLDVNRESVTSRRRDQLARLVELHTDALGRQRAFINALITAFPAIGLIATLHGLIVALSRASGIVAGTESERFSATELVTGVLSSSFATTLLALTAMAICMLLNTREEHQEAHLLQDTHRRLITVFWPGRP